MKVETKMSLADERNFRSAYYEKVGCKNVEERKSLEILLKEKIVDRVKLKQFCLRYSVPATFRSLVWKICLGILPVHTECHAFIIDQQKQEYNELIHALHTMRRIDCNTPKPKALYAVYILQTNPLRLHNSFRTSNGFCEIIQFMMPYYKDDSEMYWLAKGIFSLIHSFDNDLPKLVETICGILEKEEPALHNHLKTIGALESLPYENCFHSYFANMVHFPPLSKIWDKLCGGSCNIFVYVFVCLLAHFKHLILKCNNLADIRDNINKINEDNAEVIFNKAIDMWQQNGSYLTIHDKPKS